MGRSIVVLVVCASMASVPDPACAAGLSGSWSGTFAAGEGRSTGGTVTVSVAAAGKGVAGTVVLDTDGIRGAVRVKGRVRGKQAWLSGRAGGMRFRWRGRWVDGAGEWRGPAVARSRAARARGMLVLGRGALAGADCGAADDFAQHVMPTVFEPVCAQCHVSGGAAETTRLRVTPGQPVATMLSALRLVDMTTPAASLLLEKPRAEVPHVGGQRIVPGSTEEQVLLHWITLVTSPGCQGGGNGGGGGGGGGGGSGGPYADNCASCHGADARGLRGRSDIRCSRSIHDVVRSGRTGGAAGDMPAFPALSEGDITTIQDFLLGLCPDATATGADLYAGNCATCHGATATGGSTAPAVRCASLVSDAVRVGRAAAMPSVSSSVLSDAGLGLIEGYLDGLCTQAGRPGADLWAGNCASCHGADARGSHNALGMPGPDVRCNRHIAPVVAEGSDAQMPAFPGLSSGDVTAIQQYMIGLCPSATATGAELFAGNCSSCHGTAALGGTNGQPPVRCSRSIADAITSGRGSDMPPFALMASPEIARVQTFLDGLCPPGTATGPELVASNCAFCHGPTAGGTTNALSVRCATQIADALGVGRGARMPAFPTLTGVDLTTIETALGDYCSAAGRTGADLWAGNCASCHGDDAGGGQNGLGVRGPDIACTSATDYLDKIRQGEGGMPSFPALSNGDSTAIHDWVHATYCAGG